MMNACSVEQVIDVTTPVFGNTLSMTRTWPDWKKKRGKIMAGGAGRGAGQGVAPLAPPPESPASGAPAQQTNDTRYEQHYI